MGIFGFFKNIAVSFLVILLLVTISIFVMSNVLQDTLLEPSYYQEQFEKNNFYSSVRGMFLQNMAKDQGGGELKVGSQTISQDTDWRDTVTWYTYETKFARFAKAVLGLIFHSLTKVECVGLENIPPSGPCVVAANHFANAFKIGFSGNSQPEKVPPEVLSYLEIKGEYFEQIKEEIENEIAKAHVFLELSK